MGGYFRMNEFEVNDPDDERVKKFAGKIGFSTGKEKEDRETGEVGVRLHVETGYTCWWPKDHLEEVDPSELSPIVNLGELDVRNPEAIHDAMMNLVSKIEFLGVPTRMSVFIADIRQHGENNIIGGEVSNMMAAKAYADREKKEENPLARLLGMGG